MSERSEIWTSGELVGAGGQAQSSWFDVRRFDLFAATRNSTGGTYALEIDWSNDGIAVDQTDTVTVPNDAAREHRITPPLLDRAVASLPVLFARFRVRNTGGAAFTAHRTIVVGLT